jgi:putative spermidine/putrescine transport system permease protein
MSAAAARDRRWLDTAWTGVLWGLMALFLVNIGLMIAAVATNSFARRWLGTWLPEGWTTTWYTSAWKEFQLDAVLIVTVQVVFAVVFLSLVIGVPAAYTLARRDFRGKRLLMLLFLLPLMVPPITYGIPLATVLYKFHLAGTIWGVILANLIPAAPFVILVMTPFIEQIDPNLESAARVFGASTGRMFWYVLVPLLGRGSSPRRCSCWCARSRCSSSRS